MIAEHHPKEDGETTIFIGKSADFISFGAKFAKETLQMVGSSDVVMEFFTKIIERESMLAPPLESVNGFGFYRPPFFDKSEQEVLSLIVGWGLVNGISIVFDLLPTLLFGFTFRKQLAGVRGLR